MNNRMRKAVESLYQHKATISVKKSQKKGSITTQKLDIIHSAVPCRVSLRSQKATDKDVTASTEYDARLYLNPVFEVPNGAEITVTDVNGRVTKYIGGRSFGYVSHQEIYLKYRDRVV